MIWNKEPLWAFILRRLAKAQGFLDPASVFQSLQHFSKPSEVWVPTELLRDGAVLQARGLVNSQAIQHNLDWVWPFWVNHQFNPQDIAFIPRSFGISHINLSHRNWTAVGTPDFPNYPLVDPRGLVTPFWDSWSIDVWIMAESHPSLFPSQMEEVQQSVHHTDGFMITTACQLKEAQLESQVQVVIEQGVPTCEIMIKAQANYRAWLIINVRPYNPEGVSFIHDIRCLKDKNGWQVNKDKNVFLKEQPARYIFSNYHLGDMSQQIPLYYKNMTQEKEIQCPVGMASASAIYEMEPLQTHHVTVSIPLSTAPLPQITTWEDHLENHCTVKVPDKLFQSLYDIAIRTLILHSPNDIFPGPFTYKRFWFRDATYILNAMITVGLLRNVEKIMDNFSQRQTPKGYFKSQDGEWDSNGQVLWIMQRYGQCRNMPLKPQWIKSMVHGAKWIEHKRVSNKEQSPHAGLLPPGFSAEHFGPNDYYYWDDFWSVAGLKSMSRGLYGQDPALADKFSDAATDLSMSIEKSLALTEIRLHSKAIPASPYRRMDGAAVGGMVASYPLQLYPARDPCVMATLNYLLKKCFLDGAFYHEISHSGINIYLTLHVAQVLLRAQDDRFFKIVQTVAQLATSTGQWPEAIHPHTKGGCMGDGQHLWATAEWVCMIRNMFVREEEEARTIILCSGIPAEWLATNTEMYLGYTLTIFGKIAVTLTHTATGIKIYWDGQWHGKAPAIEVHLSGYRHICMNTHDNWIELHEQDRVTQP